MEFRTTGKRNQNSGVEYAIEDTAYANEISFENLIVVYNTEEATLLKTKISLARE
jgi:hypothetical protein